MSAPHGDTNETRRAVPPLVVAKTTAPLQRADLVRRDKLIRLLSDEHDRRVSLVHAPAGYGKTSVLLQWAKADPVRRFGWLTLEKADNDPALFWRYLILALRALVPGFADRAWGLLHRPQPDLDVVITHVLNSLIDVTGRLVVVLDDYHVITNQQCHDSMQYFIDHLPRSAHVVLGTRARPPLSLSKLETGGMLLVVDSTALKFTLEETRKALDGADRRLSPAEVARVHDATEGWPAGVYLTAIAHDPHSVDGAPSGRVGAVHSYLTEQMIGGFSGDERSVLATWSILRHLNGSLCDRVADREASATRLEQLSKTNLLLMPLDANGDWYRFHDLLRDALRREFARRPAEEQRVAHLQAMEWWLEEGDIAQAIHHAMEADDHERAADLICANWLEYMLGGWLETLGGWINRIPIDAMFAYPPILVASAWIAAFSGDVKATHRFAAAARGASFDGPMPDRSASYASAVAILRAGLGHDGMEDASEHAELAYRVEPPGSPWRQLAAALAGVNRFGLERFEDARIALAEAAQTPTGEDGTATYARGQLALLEMYEGNWEEGSRHADLACAQIEASNLANLLSSGAAQVAAAAAASHVGNHGLAAQRLRALAPIQRVLSDAIPFDAFQINLVAAETYLLLGDYRAASIHARTASSRLETFGDAGIFEKRLAEVQTVLSSEGQTVGPREDELEPLTDRELQILALLQSDLSVREIGSELFVSRNTAKSHVASVYRKLGVTSRTAAVEQARHLELI
jgi:LuxR family maltose regulon positive regulatory protein